jgi:chromobox protein 1
VTDKSSSGAKAVLDAYHKSIGGPPSPRKKASAKKSSAKEKTTGRGSKRIPDSEENNTPAASKKRRSSKSDADSQTLPLGTWEDDVTVNAIVQKTVAGAEQPDPVTGTLQGLVLWSSTGRKTEHDMEVLRQKCPQRLLDYYEAHL